MTGIDGRTKICGVIGFPIDHTLSPLLHNYAYRRLGLNYRYLAFPVRPADLPAALQGLAALHITGINVTAPHKEAVLPFLGRIEPAAAATGSVNTICCREGMLEGFSTDGQGFLWSLREEGGFVPTGKTALLLGAGGAARAVSYALSGRGLARLIIMNRSEQRAAALAQMVHNQFPSLLLETASLTITDIKNYLPQAALIVNCLSTDPWAWKEVPALADRGTLAYDLRYHPPRPDFLNWAQRCGFSVLNGLGMLLAQAALSFGLFTGAPPPFDLMKEGLIKSKLLENIYEN